MRTFIGLLVLLPLWGCGPDGDKGNVLSPRGLGPVDIGMTTQAAQTALGAALRPRPSAGDECWYTSRADGVDSTILYMVSAGAIVRVDLRDGAKGTDARGLGLGAEEKAVIAAYGDAAKIAPHKYVEGGHTLRIAGPKDKAGDTALVFETAEGKVAALRAGRVPFVDYVEGCG